jgi:hypothetical protein
MSLTIIRIIWWWLPGLEVSMGEDLACPSNEEIYWNSICLLNEAMKTVSQ